MIDQFGSGQNLRILMTPSLEPMLPVGQVRSVNGIHDLLQAKFEHFLTKPNPRQPVGILRRGGRLSGNVGPSQRTVVVMSTTYSPQNLRTTATQDIHMVLKGDGFDPAVN